MKCTPLELLRKIVWQFGNADPVTRLVAVRQAERVRTLAELSWSEIVGPRHARLASLLDGLQSSDDQVALSAALQAHQHVCSVKPGGDQQTWDHVIVERGPGRARPERDDDHDEYGGNVKRKYAYFYGFPIEVDEATMAIMEEVMRRMATMWGYNESGGSAGRGDMGPGGMGTGPKSRASAPPPRPRHTCGGSVPVVVTGCITELEDVPSGGVKFKVDAGQDLYGPIIARRARLVQRLRAVKDTPQRVTTRMGSRSWDDREAVRVVDAGDA